MTPDMKAIGVQQAEFRVGNVVRGLRELERSAQAFGLTRMARKVRLRRQGAELALEEIHELQRNYEGRE